MDPDFKVSDSVVDQKDQTISVPEKHEVENKPIDVINKLSEEEIKQKEKEDREQALAFYKHMWMKKHNIDGVDIEEEIKLIQKKESRLSRSQRDAVVMASQIFPILQKQTEVVEEKEVHIGTPATSEDLKKAIEASEAKKDE